MDLDKLKFKLENGEAQYLKRTVGHALNQCVTELIQVRPTDPVEYMGLWMLRYVDSRNYYKQKQTYYEELLKVKMDMDAKRRALLANYNESVRILNDSMKEERKSTASFQLSSKTSKNSRSRLYETSVSASQHTLLETDGTRYFEERDSLGSENDRISLVMSPTSSKLRWDRVSNASKVSSKVVKQFKRAEASKLYPQRLSDSSNSSSTFKNEEVEAAPAKWKVHGNHVVCHHPILGLLQIQPPTSRLPIENSFMYKKFEPQSFYDPELYTNYVDAELEMQSAKESDRDSQDTTDTTKENDILRVKSIEINTLFD